MDSMRVVCDKALHEINIGKTNIANCIAIQGKTVEFSEGTERKRAISELVKLQIALKELENAIENIRRAMMHKS